MQSALVSTSLILRLTCKWCSGAVYGCLSDLAVFSQWVFLLNYSVCCSLAVILTTNLPSELSPPAQYVVSIFGTYHVLAHSMSSYIMLPLPDVLFGRYHFFITVIDPSIRNELGFPLLPHSILHPLVTLLSNCLFTSASPGDADFLK